MRLKGVPRPEYTRRELLMEQAQTLSLVGCTECQGDVDNCKPCTLAITRLLATAAERGDRG